MCCGSGCIGLAIAKNTNAEVWLSDISDGAVAVSKKNTQALGCNNVKIIKSDLFENISGKFDMIVSNPPYITQEEYSELDPQVRDFEPATALLGALEFYKKISSEAKEYLNDKGRLLFEIGCFQASDVMEILDFNGFKNISCKKDLAQRDRVIVCTKN